MNKVFFASADESKLAIVSISVQKFIAEMMNAIEFAGFKGKDFLDKIEIFLISVTPNYSINDFKGLLEEFIKIDESFLDTRFAKALIALRKCCNNEDYEISDSKIITNKSLANTNQAMQQEVIFFALHLITNIIKLLDEVKKNSQDIQTIPIEKIRYEVMNNLYSSIQKTIHEIKISENLNAT